MKFVLALLAFVFSVCHPTQSHAAPRPSCCGPIHSPGIALEFEEGRTIDFGYAAVGDTVVKTVTLKNSGAKSATGLYSYGASEAFNFSGGTYPGTGGTCSTTLKSLESCTYVLQFNPQTRGRFDETFSVAYTDDKGSDQETHADLIASSDGAARLSISDSPSFNFGEVTIGTTAEKTFVVTNSGASTAFFTKSTELIAPFSYKDGAFPGYGATCTVSLAPGATCTVIIDFKPADAESLYGSVSFDYNDGTGDQTLSLDIEGTGI